MERKTEKGKIMQTILDNVVTIYEKKNEDYGDSFADTYKDFGPISSAIRLNDKLNRFKSLIKPGHQQQVNDESIEDTLKDLIAYAAMTLVEMEESKKGPKESYFGGIEVNIPQRPECHIYNNDYKIK